MCRILGAIGPNASQMKAGRQAGSMRIVLQNGAFVERKRIWLDRDTPLRALA